MREKTQKIQIVQYKQVYFETRLTVGNDVLIRNCKALSSLNKLTQIYMYIYPQTSTLFRKIDSVISLKGRETQVDSTGIL